MKDRREYVRITIDLPDNPKLVDASTAAKWLYVTALCYAGQHLTDGHVNTSACVSRAQVRQKSSAELIARGLIHEAGHDCKECDQPRPGSFIIHDYLQHQRSRQEAEDSRSGKRKGADLTNHKRWHEKPDPECRYCRRYSDRSSDQSSESLERSLNGRLPHRSRVAEGEVEVEGGLGSQSGVGRTSDGQSDGLDLTKIATALGQDERWARRVATDVQSRAGQPIGTGYVLAAIKAEPERYRPTSGPPPISRLCPHGRDNLTCPDPPCRP